MAHEPVIIGLSAVVMAMRDGEVAVLTVRGDAGASDGLPSGPFDPYTHRTFELGLRDFVTVQTGLELGYVEQLYTFGDAGRDSPRADLRGDRSAPERVVSVGYLALAQEARPATIAGAVWRPWRDFFPYEDWRGGRPAVIDSAIAPDLARWAGSDPARLARVQTLFALGEGCHWHEERVLDRYELLYEAGLTAEGERDRNGGAASRDTALGQPMASDHRRILATGLGRLRGKLRYRPVVFDLMASAFALSTLQKTVEAIIGLPLHKQNFRRGVERTGLVEPTGRIVAGTGGRPAELFQRHDAASDEAQALGLPLPRLR